MESKASVLPGDFSKGPHGLGDPNDKSLRKVEIEILIPTKMRNIAKKEKCSEYVNSFTSCCKDNGVIMFMQCRKENNQLKQCLQKWYTDDQFKNHCTEIYLKERTEYRLTGKEQKTKRKEAATF